MEWCVLIGAGLISLSILFGCASVSRYIDQLSHEYWDFLRPYLVELWFPILLSVICVLLGLIFLIREKRRKK